MSFGAALVLYWVEIDFKVNNEADAERMYTAQWQDRQAPLFHYLAGFSARLYGHVDLAIQRFELAQLQVRVLG